MSRTASLLPASVRTRRGGEDPAQAARRIWWRVAIVLNLVLLPLLMIGRVTTAALIVLLIGVLARHDGVVRLLGHGTETVPAYRRHQLIYQLGQLHRAMAVAVIGWVLIAAAVQTARSLYVAAVLTMVAVAVGAMVWTARNSARGAHHNRFEMIHRWVGWSVLMVVVAVVGMETTAGFATGALSEALGLAVLLVLIVGSCLHPWTTVRRVPVEVLDVTRGLVVLAIPGRRRVGDFLRVSLEGREWHSFAVSTCGREGADRCCLVIRRAGDWTERLGQLCSGDRPPTSLLVRQLRGFGFMGHVLAYRRVLVIATGAGIGPVLLYLLDQTPPGLHCLWIGRDHRETIGADLVEQVLAGGHVTLIDTADGRPDLTDLVTRHATATDAVFVVSNGPVRDQVAAACNRLGLPWYGPTFDS